MFQHSNLVCDSPVPCTLSGSGLGILFLKKWTHILVSMKRWNWYQNAWLCLWLENGLTGRRWYIKDCLMLVLLSVFLCLFILSFSSKHCYNEKTGIAAERFGHDGPDKRWTLPFSLLCLFGCVFVWAVSQRAGSLVLHDKLTRSVWVCVYVSVCYICFNCLNDLYEGHDINVWEKLRG